MFIYVLVGIEWLLLAVVIYGFYRFCLIFYRRFTKNVYPTYLEVNRKCAILRSHGEDCARYQLTAFLATFAPFVLVGYTAWMIGFMFRILLVFTAMSLTNNLQILEIYL